MRVDYIYKLPLYLKSPTLLATPYYVALQSVTKQIYQQVNTSGKAKTNPTKKHGNFGRMLFKNIITVMDYY